MGRIVCAFLELRDQKSYVTSFVEQEHIGDEFFFPFPLFVPCFLRSKTHRNRGVAGFSEKSLSRVSLLPTGIIFPRNDKSTVERSLRLEVDLDRIFDFSSAAKPRTLIDACRVDSKNVLDYLNIFFLRCFRVVRTQ